MPLGNGGGYRGASIGLGAAAPHLEDLARKTRRGGGLSFGYGVRHALRADGTPVTGELGIAEDEAAWLRRAFRACAGEGGLRRSASLMASTRKTASRKY